MDLIARGRELLWRWMTAVETAPWGPGHLAAVLAGIIALRNLLEIALVRNPIFEGLAAFVHYPLAYVGPFLSLSLVLAFWGRVAPARVARLMVLAWLLTLMPPLVDLLLARYHGTVTIGYMAVEPGDLLWTVVHFFDPTVRIGGTTLGIRVETLAAVLLGAFFVRLRARSWLRAAGAALTVYLVSLFWFTLPTLVLLAWRLVLPRVSRPDLLFGEGLLFRPHPDTSADSTGILWLVPVLLVLGWLWGRVERRDGREVWLHRPQGRPPLPGAGWLLTAALLAGTLTALTLRLDPGQFVAAVPYDWMALGGALLALAVASAALQRWNHDPGWRSVALLLAALLLVVALGRSAATGIVAAAAALVPATLLRLPGGWQRIAGSVGLAVGGLSAFAGGFALVVGPEALARMPFPPAVGWLVAGAILGLLVAGEDAPAWQRAAALVGAVLLGLTPFASPAVLLLAALVSAGVALLAFVAPELLGGRPRRSRAALLAGVLLVALQQAAVGREPLRAEYRERMRCVARLERIRGEQFLDRGELTDATRAFRSALACDEGDAGAWRGLGLRFLRSGNLERAEANFRRALELAPSSVQELTNLAAVELRLERPAAALERLDRAVRLDPRDVHVLFNRAQALDALGRTREAEEAWRRYLAVARWRPEEANSLRQAQRRLRRGASAR
jgi:tetratricopeptide (TPR) repeat protein